MPTHEVEILVEGRDGIRRDTLEPRPPGPFCLNGWAWAGPPCSSALLYEERPLCLQRLPEAAVSIAAQVIGLHEGANQVHLANVLEGCHVDAPAVDAVILPLGHHQLL